MKFSKPSAGLVELFKSVRATLGAEPRKMFGYDCFFVNGNFAAGLWQDTCVFKLSEADGKRFMEIDGARPFAPMKGRAMRGWYEAPEEVAHDAEQLEEWCRRARDFAASAPPKAKKTSAKTAKKTSAKTAKKTSAKTAKKAPAKSPSARKER